MSKTTVTRLFVGSLLALTGGFVLLFITALVGASYGAFIMNGPDVVGIHSTGLGVAIVALACIGMLAVIGGGIGQLVAWIGALLNTAELQDKSWFLVLLFLGALSFGFFAMLAYVVAGPDGTTARGKAPAVAPGHV